jgi:hypothetical protein
MFRPDQLERGNLRFVPREREKMAVAALLFVRWIEDGTAIEPAPIETKEQTDGREG